jgi:ribulose-phosphate 3-epimerase
MKHIAPAIIPESLAHLRESLALVRPFTREVQVDIVDGDFVPFTSWPYVPKASVEDLALFTPTFTIEMDLMVRRPEEVIPLYARVGVRSMVVHVESTEDLGRIFMQRRELGFSLGLSVGNDTPLSHVTDHIEEIDYVQLMGIAHIGSQGQPFDVRVLERIAFLKERYPKLMVSVDGGVKEDTLPKLIEAGADRAVAGSAIFAAEDPEAAYAHLSRAW